MRVKFLKKKKMSCSKTEKEEEEEETDYQIITAEGIAKRKNSPIPWKISIEMGALVFAQALLYFMYNPSKITFNQYDIPIAKAAPKC